MTDIQTIIEPQSQSNIQVVKFIGQLDETNVDTEAQKIYALLENIADKPVLILDFEDLGYMNSKSIGYVTDWFNKTMEKNGKLIIAAPRPNILDILTVVGLSSIIEISNTTQEAKNSAASF